LGDGISRFYTKFEVLCKLKNVFGLNSKTQNKNNIKLRKTHIKTRTQHDHQNKGNEHTQHQRAAHEQRTRSKFNEAKPKNTDQSQQYKQKPKSTSRTTNK
jgi:hypothetical protein